MHENVASESGRGTALSGRSSSLVPFLFGVAQRPELPGTVLTRLLGDLGLTEAAARALLLRMRQEGKLESVRRGRGVGYRLAGEYGRRFDRIRQGAGDPQPTWTGSFHALVYRVPESRRAFRDGLRRAAVHLGYGLLQQGVLVNLQDRSAELDLLAEPPEDVRVFVARLEMTEPDAARAALLAWDLDDLADLYSGHVRTLDAAVRARSTPPEPGPETLRRYAELLRAPMVDTLRAPRLPDTLLPPDWPLPRLWQAIRRVQQVFAGPSVGYVTGQVDAATP